MCEQCDKANGTHFFQKHQDKPAPAKDTQAAEKDRAEHEVSPQSNSTMTVLTPAPGAGIASAPSLESIINSNTY